MPKSKRARVVALTKTEKKGRGKKTDLINRVRACVDEFENIYIFSFANLRTQPLKELRLALGDSRIFLGKNKVMRVAFGRGDEDEYRENLHKLSERLVGNVGLLFSNLSADELRAKLDEHVAVDFARSGTVATHTVRIEAQGLPGFQHTMVEELRKLGLPVDLKNSVVTLYAPHTICKAKDVLTPEQCRLLKHFGVQMAEFRLHLLCSWSEGALSDFVEFDDHGRALLEGVVLPEKHVSADDLARGVGAGAGAGELEDEDDEEEEDEEEEEGGEEEGDEDDE